MSIDLTGITNKNEYYYGAVLGKMLNHKVDVAYQMLTSGKTFAVPQYVKDAIGWLRG